MKTSFANIDPTKDAVVPVVPTSAEAIVPDDFFNNDSGIDGEINRSDIRMPFLNLVHGVGPLSTKGYLPGSIVFNQESLLTSPTQGVMSPDKGVEISVVRGKKDYFEYINDAQFQAGVRPRHFNTEAEARAAGLFSGKECREDKTRGRFGPALTLQVLVKGRPEDGFPIDFEGASYAMAALTLNKSSYYAAATTLITFMDQSKQLGRPNYWSAFQLYTKQEKPPGSANFVWSFRVQKSKRNSEPFVAMIKDLLVTK
jgi:hypothetical protein